MKINKAVFIGLSALLFVGVAACSEGTVNTDETSQETDPSSGADGDTDTDTDTGADGGTGVCPELEMVNQPGGTISEDTTWPAAIYLVEGSLTIRDGTLTVAPCSVIKMADSTRIDVNESGALNMIGTPEQPITVTSAKSIPQAGDWNRIEFAASSNNLGNVMNYVNIEYGGGSSYGSIYIDSDASLAMTDSAVRYSGDVGIDMDGDAHLRKFEGNVLSHNAKGPISLSVNSVDDLGLGNYSGNDVEGIILKGGTVDHDATWLNHNVPYVTTGPFYISSDSGSAHLTLEEGTTLKINEGSDFSVEENGGLTLAGTADNPVIVTSAKEIPAPGDWGQINIYSTSVDAYNIFTYAVIEYGGDSSYGAIWLDSGASLAMSDSSVRYSNDVGIDMDGDAHLREFEGNVLTNNANGPVSLDANSVDDLGTGTYSGNDIEGIIVRGGTVDHDATWLNHDAPYVTTGSFSIESSSGSAHLTIEAGTTLKINEGSDFSVSENGGLTLNGTEDAQVTITCAKPVCSAGDWGQINIYGGSIDAYNVFTYTHIEYGGDSSYGQLWLGSGAGVTLDNTIFSNSGDTCDIENDGGTITEVGGNTFVLCVD